MMAMSLLAIIFAYIKDGYGVYKTIKKSLNIRFPPLKPDPDSLDRGRDGQTPSENDSVSDDQRLRPQIHLLAKWQMNSLSVSQMTTKRSSVLMGKHFLTPLELQQTSKCHRECRTTTTHLHSTGWRRGMNTFQEISPISCQPELSS